MKAVNLLPPELRTTVATTVSTVRAAGSDAKGGAGPFVVLGVLAALVAGTAGSVLTSNQIADKQAELAVATQDATTVQSQAAALKPYADFDAVAKARVATVSDLAGRRFDWEQTLRDLSRAVPAEVTLSSLTGDLGGGSSSSGNALRSAISAPAIDLQGCTDSQKGVATLMSRLNDVDGVTRVSLSKSTKGAATTTATTDAAPCGKGSKPTFEIVIFFEHEADKSSVTGTATTAAGTTAAGATATPAPAASATATPAATTATTASTGGTTP
jgi:Tfp pilus assembly protein PilN